MGNAAAEQARQREYYAQTASAYDQAHSYENALDFAIFKTFIEHLNVTSILDIGSGTGRALITAKETKADIRAVGIEPASALRERGHAKGLTRSELIDGDAQHLSFKDDSFDLACEFAALHHIPRPDLAVSEMIRVARKAVFISDANNFGQGGLLARGIKQAINAVGLWPLADWIRTRGKGFHYSEGDGVFYSYSAFSHLPALRTACREVYVFGDTKGRGSNLYRSSPFVVIIGVK